MTQQRIIAVGDIHGCYSKLKKMLGRLQWSPDSGDLLIFLGDYIDRGPQSYDVVETLIELSASPRVICLMGNHERMFLDFISGQTLPSLYANGIAATVRDYCSGDHEMSETHLTFLRNLKLYHETEHHIFVHAGLAPGRPLAEQTPHDMLWIREKFLQSDHDFGKTIVFGHTPFREPVVSPGRIGLDTGAVYGGSLTAVILPEERFIYVD
ncbi:serine/threonine protein phosphatase [Deltaproteobacteria bacterium Smac51]|nr:serine/threonine protein phosphatase [Deltaproteobacteria bacterium Smac51]